MDLCLLSNNKTPIVFCGTDQVTVTRSAMLLANLSYMEPVEWALVRQWHERASRHYWPGVCLYISAKVTLLAIHILILLIGFSREMKKRGGYVR